MQKDTATTLARFPQGVLNKGCSDPAPAVFRKQCNIDDIHRGTTRNVITPDQFAGTALDRQKIGVAEVVYKMCVLQGKLLV